MLNARDYKLVVTSGPTREWLDPVRFLSNPSSGKTGWAIARAGRKMFGEVVYISGPGYPEFRRVEGAENILIETTSEMAKAVKKNIGPSTILIMAAAPADFVPVTEEKKKIKKDSIVEPVIRLTPPPDILLSITKRKRKDFYRVGFAAETDHVLSYARTKLEAKNLNYICANQVFRDRKGFGDNLNTLMVLGRDGSFVEIGPSRKEENARKLLKYLLQNCGTPR